MYYEMHNVDQICLFVSGVQSYYKSKERLRKNQSVLMNRGFKHNLIGYHARTSFMQNNAAWSVCIVKLP